MENNIPKILLTDNESSLMEKFKHYFFAILRSDLYTAFYILKNKGSKAIDTPYYFGVTLDSNGMIDSVFNNKTDLPLKYVIESEFDNVTCDSPSFVGATHVSVHWPEPDEDDNEDEDVEEIQYIEPDEDKIVWPDPSKPLKPVWLGEKVEPLKPVEDN